MKKKYVTISIQIEGERRKEMWFKKLDEEVIETLEDFLDELSDNIEYKNDDTVVYKANEPRRSKTTK